jgi:hypothetical protein
MSFISRDSDFYDIPASTYLGLARDSLNIPHITCLTVNGQDLTVGAPVTTGGVQTLTNKTLVDTSTYIIDDIDPTRRIQFDASAVTAASDIIIQATGDGTITLPDPGGAALTLIGVGPAPSLAGDWTFTNATPSVSTVTGTIVNSGGMGIAGDIYIGASTNSAGVLRVTDVTTSTSTITGCATFGGGIGVAENLYVGGLLRVTDVTTSTSTITGCATYGGGVGIVENLYVGGLLRVTDATTSTTVATGCATFGGGVGIVENLYVGGLVRATNATASTSTITGCATYGGGIGVTGAIYAGLEVHWTDTIQTIAVAGWTRAIGVAPMATTSFTLRRVNNTYILVQNQPIQFTTSADISNLVLTDAAGAAYILIDAAYRPSGPRFILIPGGPAVGSMNLRFVYIDAFGGINASYVGGALIPAGTTEIIAAFTGMYSL